jgi:hypothetical protein
MIKIDPKSFLPKRRFIKSVPAVGHGPEPDDGEPAEPDGDEELGSILQNSILAENFIGR